MPGHGKVIFRPKPQGFCDDKVVIAEFKQTTEMFHKLFKRLLLGVPRVGVD